MNSSNVFSNTSQSYELSLIASLTLANDIVEGLTTSIGTVLNLWTLLAILTCKDIWSRSRNKIICSLCSLHLLTSLVFLPISMDATRRYRRDGQLNCLHQSLIMHMYMMQDFISNWTLVLMMVIFVSQVCDYKPHAGFTKLATVIGTYTTLALPWVGSLFTIPVTTTLTFDSFLQRKNISNYAGCIFPTLESHRVVWWLDTTVPLLVAAALLVTADVLRRRRFTRGFSNVMQVKLIDGGPEIDNHCGYTAAVVVTLVCDLTSVLIIFERLEYRSTEWLIFNLIFYLMSITKTVFIPLTWFFFPDIRERLKTWRPWHWAKPGIDLTLVYKSKS